MLVVIEKKNSSENMDEVIQMPQKTKKE